MSIHYSVRFASHPKDVKSYDTEQLRNHFLIEELFKSGEIHLLYSHYDRFIIGGVKPTTSPLQLESIQPLKSNYFADRRELGVINIGETGVVIVDDRNYKLEHKEALYIGKGSEKIIFKSHEQNQPLFYLNSAPAHQVYPTKKITHRESEVVELGSFESSNHRVIRKLIVNSIVDTCQLQMGMTEMKPGSVWNTMPAHVHDRRMEAYLYFDLPEDQVVCHFIGEPEHTRHIWLRNHQAVLSPPWSIHSGSGTSNYTFIWGMAGENLDYTDMEICKVTDLR
ncbi:MAG: 5-dehydro-4-deoxy-D-glucuronate isomerase [Balneolaceae bacterium]|nr:5-dehydro-4-deoxy-D-glucuronate isomerase [Balneolaceae bacterium]